MTEPLRLMCVLAHPDDESLGTGGTLAKYAAEGVETYLITATRGERGWFGPPDENPGLARLGEMREAELRAAVERLGLCELHLLDYIDGDLDQADPREAIHQIVGHIRRIRPQVVITFDPTGAYGHPDHIAICQFASAAIVAAADCDYDHPAEARTHRVSKLYYLVASQELGDLYESVFGELIMHIDGMERRGVAFPNWGITTLIDSSAYWRQVWEAIACHQTQLPNYQALLDLPDEIHRRLWGVQEYYRAFSLVNGGRITETDLFAGLR
jgi:LmbE family N-acetylglucosaminyl deacetylase